MVELRLFFPSLSTISADSNGGRYADQKVTKKGCAVNPLLQYEDFRIKQASNLVTYHIYSAIRWGFSLYRMTTNNLISPMKFCHNMSFTLYNPKDLDPSYMMDLDLWNCFGRKKKTMSYIQRNMVKVCWI